MKFLRHLTAFLLGIVLALTGWSYISSGTLFNSHFLLAQAESAKIYPVVATAAPSLLGELTPLTFDERALLGQFVSVSFVRDRFSSLLPQLERYYRTGGVRPALDLRDLKVTANSANVALPPALDQRLAHPLPVTAGALDPRLSQIVRWSDHLRIIGPIIIALLLGFGWLIGRKRRGLLLAEAFLVGAGGALIASGIVLLIPRLVASTAKTSAVNPLTAPLTDWLKAATAVPSHQLIVFAVGLATLALVASTLHGLLLFGGLFRRQRHER